MDLALAMTIKVSNEEFEQLDEEKSIKFADGSGYIAEPSVYHELHCIVSLCFSWIKGVLYICQIKIVTSTLRNACGVTNISVFIIPI